MTNPAFPLEDLPSVDVVVLSHFHAGEFDHRSPQPEDGADRAELPGGIDHFDQLVQEKLRKDLPIVTTKHAEEELRGIQGNGGGFSEVVSFS